MKNIIKKLLVYATTSCILTSSYNVKTSSNDIIEKNQITTTQEDTTNYKMAAHRGFSSKEIENTKKAISLASKKNYIDYIEIDVRLTKDNEIILSHNDTLYITPYDKKLINTSTYDELTSTQYIHKDNIFKDILLNAALYDFTKVERQIKLNNKTYKICNLENAIKSSKDKKIILDIKFNNNIKIFSETLLQKLQGYEKDKFIIQSSNLTGLLYLKNLAPDYEYQAIISKESSLLYGELFDDVCLKKTIIDYDYVKEKLDEDKKVSVWTLNSKYDVDNVTNKLNDLSKDIIYITDYPDMVYKDLNNKTYLKK